MDVRVTIPRFHVPRDGPGQAPVRYDYEVRELLLQPPGGLEAALLLRMGPVLLHHGIREAVEMLVADRFIQDFQTTVIAILVISVLLRDHQGPTLLLHLPAVFDEAEHRLQRATRPLAVVPPGGSVRGERVNLTRLVICCIETKFCKKICVGKLSPKSTQCTPFHSSLLVS